YDCQLFEAEMIEQLMRHWERLLVETVNDPFQKVSQVHLLNEAERQQVVSEWNRTGGAYDDSLFVHRAFELQVEKTPHAPALSFEQRSLTYSELNARANQLGNYLRERGVGPETLVAIYMERSLEM